MSTGVNDYLSDQKYLKDQINQLIKRMNTTYFVEIDIPEYDVKQYV